MKRRRPLSLSARLILLLLASELFLLGGFSWSTYLFTRNQWLVSFDSVLLANSEAVASLTELEHEHFEVELSSEMRARFVQKDRPDIYAILSPEGALLSSSQSLKSLPKWVAPVHETRMRDFRWDGHAYRGMIFSAVVDSDSPLDSALRRVTVFYGKSRHDLDEELAAAQRFIFVALPLVFAISIVLVLLIVRRGLAPLNQFARRTGALNEHTLATRFASNDYPSDLQPLISAFNAMLASLESAFAREKQFSSDAAHELRTPLATLKSGIQAALLCPRDPQEDRRVFDDLLTEVQRLESLCETLLEIGTATGDPQQAALECAELIESIQITLESLEPLAAARGSRISLHVPQGALPAGGVRTTEMHTRRILLNLIANAINHGGEQISIAVSITPRPDALEICVEDDGAGVAEEAREFLFRRLFKAEVARSDQGGAGLGLALSRGLAEQCGGSLHFEPRPGGGSRFIWRVLTRATSSHPQ